MASLLAPPDALTALRALAMRDLGLPASEVGLLLDLN